MARHQLHRPAAAPEAFAASSALKSELSKYASRNSHVSSLICAFGKFIRDARNPLSPIIFMDSLLQFSSALITCTPFTSCQSIFDIGYCRSTNTVSRMRAIKSGGFFSALTVAMSLAFMEFSALTAASIAGCAFFKSDSASSLTAAISSAFAVTPSTMTFTFAFSFSAIAVFALISFSKAAASACAVARSLFFVVKSTCMVLTSFLASKSFRRPLLIFVASVCVSLSFLVYKLRYPSMNERYDFGVTYTFRLNFSKYSLHALVTATCTLPMCSWSLNLSSSEHAMGKSPMNLVLTAMSASWGHGRNQSMVHPFINPGKFRARVAKASPTGEKHKHVCRLSLTLDRKSAYRLSHVSIISGNSFFATGRMSLTIMSSSSLGKSPATSPVIRIWLMNSKKLSSFTSASVKMKHTFWPFNPATLYRLFKSSNNAAWLYCLLIVIWNVNAPDTYAANLVRDCLPEPPTPTNKALPRSIASSRAMRIMCFSASSKSTKSSFSAFEVSLNIFILASATCLIDGRDTVDS
mmetsp:Transcript_631/g.2087  ORF Transcript_631/g.2087 Transcript_631/m.2087 type:complete len:522 (+) Transcript_631:157-1722(+)